MLTGDFNAHTASLPDFIVNDDDTFSPVPDQNIGDTKMSHRMNRDNRLCTYGKRLLDLSQRSKLSIVNGRKIGDTTGNLTCHKYNGSSLVNYFIYDTILFRVIQNMCVHDWLPHLSDHCSISLCFNINVKSGRSADNENLENAARRMTWDAMREHVFECKLQLPEIKAKILEISETQVWYWSNVRWYQFYSVQGAGHKHLQR